MLASSATRPLVLHYDDNASPYSPPETSRRGSVVLPSQDRSGRAPDQQKNTESTALGGTAECAQRSRYVRPMPWCAASDEWLAVRLLREELQLLHEPASYVGEVVKVMGKKKVLVKVQPEGKYSASRSVGVRTDRSCSTLSRRL